jgi:hypothetical protein
MKLNAAPALTSREAHALRTAVGFMNAGEADGVSQQVVDAANSALDKLCAAPAQAKWVALSQKEIELLWAVIENGAPETGNTLGMTAGERRTLYAAANRIADAGQLAGARF